MQLTHSTIIQILKAIKQKKKKVLTENRYMCNAKNFPVEKKKTIQRGALNAFLLINRV